MVLQNFSSKWPLLSHTQVRALNHWLHCFSGPTLQTLYQACRTLLGASVEPQLSEANFCNHQQLQTLQPVVSALVLGAKGETDANVNMVLDLDPHLAARIIDRVLNGVGSLDVPEPQHALSHTQQGILAYAISRVMAEAHVTDWHLLGVLTTTHALSQVLGDQEALMLPVTVQLGSTAGKARLWFPAQHIGLNLMGAIHESPLPGPFRNSELTLSVQLDCFCLPEREVRSMALGDVLVCNTQWPETMATRWHGLVQLCGPLQTTRWVCNVEDGRLHIVALQPSLETDVTKTTLHVTNQPVDPQNAQLSALHELPIEISVEIAQCTLSLQSLSQLAPGQVVDTGQMLGEEATLRIGNKAVASGQLINVDGQVGVRISRLAG